MNYSHLITPHGGRKETHFFQGNSQALITNAIMTILIYPRFRRHGISRCPKRRTHTKTALTHEDCFVQSDAFLLLKWGDFHCEDSPTLLAPVCVAIAVAAFLRRCEYRRRKGRRRDMSTLRGWPISASASGAAIFNLRTDLKEGSWCYLGGRLIGATRAFGIMMRSGDGRAPAYGTTQVGWNGADEPVSAAG